MNDAAIRQDVRGDKKPLALMEDRCRRWPGSCCP